MTIFSPQIPLTDVYNCQESALNKLILKVIYCLSVL